MAACAAHAGRVAQAHAADLGRRPCCSDPWSASCCSLTARMSTSEYTTNAGGPMAGRDLFWKIAWQDFLAHPLTGSGPLTYAPFYVEADPTDPVSGWLAPHAHNLYLNTLAEGGVIGGIALTWVLWTIAWTLLQGWREQAGKRNGGRQPRASLLVGVGAALAGFLVHNQPDDLNTTELLLMVLLLCAVGMHAAGKLRPGPRMSRRWGVLALAAPLVLCLLLARASAIYRTEMAGIEAAANGDWQGAARALDAASAADPGLTLYQDQRGYAYGVLAAPVSGSGDQAALQRALDSYDAALPNEPRWVPSLLNDAWLLRLAGEPPRADALLASAAQIAGCRTAGRPVACRALRRPGQRRRKRKRSSHPS